jgi:hypothetical protein
VDSPLFPPSAVNVGVFALWSYAGQLQQRFRDVSLLRTMTRNFTVSWQNLSQGRVWTLLTSAFSHEGTAHIIVNMLSLWFLGGSALAILGNVRPFPTFLSFPLSLTLFPSIDRFPVPLPLLRPLLLRHLRPLRPLRQKQPMVRLTRCLGSDLRRRFLLRLRLPEGEVPPLLCFARAGVVVRWRTVRVGSVRRVDEEWRDDGFDGT